MAGRLTSSHCSLENKPLGQHLDRAQCSPAGQSGLWGEQLSEGPHSQLSPEIPALWPGIFPGQHDSGPCCHRLSSKSQSPGKVPVGPRAAEEVGGLLPEMLAGAVDLHVPGCCPQVLASVGRVSVDSVIGTRSHGKPHSQ